MFRWISRILVLKEREMRSFWSSTRAVFSHADGILAAPSNKQQREIFFQRLVMSQKSMFSGRSTNARLQLYSTAQNTDGSVHLYHYWFLIARKVLLKVVWSIGGTDTNCVLCFQSAQGSRVVQATNKCCSEKVIPETSRIPGNLLRSGMWNVCQCFWFELM